MWGLFADISRTVSEFNRGLFTNNTVKYRAPRGKEAVIGCDFRWLMNIACKHPIFLSFWTHHQIHSCSSQEIMKLMWFAWARMASQAQCNHAVTRNLAPLPSSKCVLSPYLNGYLVCCHYGKQKLSSTAIKRLWCLVLFWLAKHIVKPHLCLLWWVMRKRRWIINHRFLTVASLFLCRRSRVKSVPTPF